MSLRTTLRPLFIGCVGAILGTLLVLSLWHSWQDHTNLHALVNLVNASQQATQKAK